ncbi:MAG TPA: AAA family ATPase [Mucilaginibacter sp.]|jgi:RecA-family ATPase|nr:AAA family ATPase [Mucilaginibacter sp.]
MNETPMGKPYQHDDPFNINNNLPFSNPKDYPAPLRINADDLMKRSLELLAEADHKKGILSLRTFDQWMEIAKNEPIPKMLFSEFWHEGELCILFSDTNLGKSVLGIQIGNSISNGKPIPGFKLEADMQPVVYFDFEMAKKQLEVRYTNNYEDHFIFNNNFYRAEIDTDEDIPDGMEFEECLTSSLERVIIEINAKVLIIDNITYLRNETEKAKDALPLMKQLKALKQKYNLSILAMAHTPKRDKAKPITRNDLQGSKMLINFCDSAFAIGEDANDGTARYLKQIKQRNTSQIYGDKNVCVCRVNKPYNFLQYEFTGFGKENDHLRDRTDDEEEKMLQQVSELHAAGKTLREIGAELGISYSKAHRLLKDND